MARPTIETPVVDEPEVGDAAERLEHRDAGAVQVLGVAEVEHEHAAVAAPQQVGLDRGRVRGVDLAAEAREHDGPAVLELEPVQRRHAY